MPGTTDRPFTGPPVETIPLEPPPLARVLTQIRFSPVLAVADETLAGQVQQRLRDEYPLVRGEVEFAVAFAVGAEAPQAATPTRLWRFQSPDDVWRASLASNFVALETTQYQGHEDFFGRLQRVLAVVNDIVVPPQVERTGVRYIQRLTDPDDLERLREYVRPEILGVCSLEDDGARLTLCLTQAQALFEDVHLTARWGLLPPNIGVDPAIDPADTASWVMDIDVFDEYREPFDADTLTQRALDHSRRQYRFFRWAVEPAFLLRFGADEALVAAAVHEEVA
jgi:uncharacterized protein (TIGR04255 family)